MRSFALGAALAAAMTLVVGARAEPPLPNPHVDAPRADVQTVAFHPTQLDLARVREGTESVPPVVPNRLPRTLASDADAQARKKLFIKTVLPAVLRVNARLRRERRFLERTIWQRQVRGRLDEEARGRLHALAERYGVEPDDLDALRLRVDTVPPSLVLAQAAIESGWGGSRFAQRGNALFGQRSYHCEQCGMRPKGYEGDPGFRVVSFQSLTQSVAAYVHNLNTHPAYAGLRKARFAARRQGRKPSALRLARHLTRYSERGQAYVRDVQSTITANDLTDFDEARLTWRPPQVARLPR